MKSKIFSQNNMGGALLLLFFLFASQTRLFDFFIDTVLGRMTLIILLIITSYLNKILGVVLVLMIIICMNNNKRDYYMEGFTGDASGNAPDASGNTAGSGKPTPAKLALAKKAKDASGNSVEGFDVLGIENTLKRGKNSNTMNSQGNSQGNSGYVEPFHESFFGNSFTAFSGNSS